MRTHTFALLGEMAKDGLTRVGTIGLLVAVFAESGLMVGFFLPGDSLLFAAGLLSAAEVPPHIWIISLGCSPAAVAGDQVGYYTGHKGGPGLFARPDSRIFKQQHL